MKEYVVDVARIIRAERAGEAITEREKATLDGLRAGVIRSVPMQIVCDACYRLPCSCPPPPKPSRWRRYLRRR